MKVFEKTVSSNAGITSRLERWGLLTSKAASRIVQLVSSEASKRGIDVSINTGEDAWTRIDASPEQAAREIAGEDPAVWIPRMHAWAISVLDALDEVGEKDAIYARAFETLENELKSRLK